jgi:hypothetical protein
VKLAISSKAYNSFTRPLPLTVVKQIAFEKNQTALPKIDEQPIQAAGGGVVPHQAMRTTDKMSQILPPNEHCNINPNI